MIEVVNKTMRRDKLAKFIEEKYSEMCSKKTCKECKYGRENCKTLFIIEFMTPKYGD